MQTELTEPATVGSSRGGSALWSAAKVALATVLAIAVLSKVSLTEMSALVSRLSWPWLLAFLVASYLSTGLLAYRSWVLIDRKTSFRQTLNLVIMQSVIGNLVAAIAGMASYVAVLRARHRVDIAQSIGSLVAARFLDLAALLAALIISASALWPQVATIGWVIALLVVALTGVLATAMLVFVFREAMVAFVARVLRALRLDGLDVVRRGLRMLEEVARQDGARMRAVAAPMSAVSLLMLGASVLSSYCSVQLFAIPIGIEQIVFMVVLVQLLGLVPIHVFGGLGVSDITVLYIYVLFGVPEATIAPVVVAARLIFYGMNLLLLVYLAADGTLSRGERG